MAATDENSRPDFTTDPKTRAVVGRQYQYDADAVDPDGDTLTFSLVAGPDGMSVHPETGLVLWKPDAGDIGVHPMTVRVVDGFGLGVDQSVEIAVAAANRPPQLHNAPLTTATAGKLYAWAVSASDPDGDDLSYSIVSAVDANGSAISGTGLGTDGKTVSWTPGTSDTGTYTFVLDITDQIEVVRIQWNVVVSADTGGGGANDKPPVIDSEPRQVVGVDETYTYQVHATDPDGDAIAYSLTAGPAGMSLPAGSDTLTWTSPAAVGDSHWVTVRATAGGVWSEQRFRLDVKAANRAPDITSTAPVAVTKTSTYRYDVQANDPDNDPLTWELVQSPAGMTIDDKGRISWDTTGVALGDYTVEIRVDDGRPNGTDTEGPFTVSVVADTSPPKVAILPQDDHDIHNDNIFEVNKAFKVVVDAVDDVAVDEVRLWLDGQPVAVKDGIATLTLAEVDTFVLTASAWDTADPRHQADADSVSISTFDPADQQYPVVSISSPDNNPTLWEPADVIGSVSDENLVNAS